MFNTPSSNPRTPSSSSRSRLSSSEPVVWSSASNFRTSDLNCNEFHQRLQVLEQHQKLKAEANRVLTQNLLESLRKRVDEIEQDKWMYEDIQLFK